MVDMFKAIGRGFKAVSKKVWITLAFVAVIFSVGATWIGVANAMSAFRTAGWFGLDTPEQRATVSGNGGPAVMVGNWLYFVGNFVDIDASPITYRQNEYNRITYGAIYRVYINPTEAAPLYQDPARPGDPNHMQHLLDESTLGTSNSRRFQLVVPKIAGFNQAALWVFDKHLIYTSPNNERDRRGQMQPGKIDFFRVDLDGSNHRRLYTTTSDSVTRDDFTVASFDGNVFILIHDGDFFRRINVTKNPGRTVTVSEDVQTIALPIVTSYRTDTKDEDNEMPTTDFDRYSLANSYAGIMSHVFFTETRTPEDVKNYGGGNKIIQYDVLTNTKIETRIPEQNISLTALSNGRLIYTVQEVGSQNPLGLYSTRRAITDEWKVPFTINRTTAPEVTRLLQGHFYSEIDTLYFRTEHTPQTEFRYATLQNGVIQLFIEGKESPDRQVRHERNSIPIPIARIISLDSNTVHFLDEEGQFGAAYLNSGEPVTWGTVGMGELRDGVESPIRDLAWVVRRNNVSFYFFLRTFHATCEGDDCDDHDDDDEHENNTMTFAMLADLSRGNSNEFILGRLDCKFARNIDCCEDD